MRLTTQATEQRRLSTLFRSQQRLETAQEQVSSGKRIHRPSDSPAEMAELLKARSGLGALARRDEGLKAALPGMKATESTLGDMASALRDVRTQTLQANNATATPEQRAALADQIGRLAIRIRDLANSSQNGQRLFSGTATGTEPFPQADPVVYTGSPNALQVEVGEDATLASSITGDQLLNSRQGTDLFKNLKMLEQSVRTGSTAQITDGLKGVDADLDNLTRLRGDMGARLQYVDLAQNRIATQHTALSEMASDIENVDFTEAVLNAKSAETAHEAALAMAGRIGSTTLLDYLR
jgi:flagellar hook-associated protein 3 FlgL